MNAPVIVMPLFSRTLPAAVGWNAINTSQLPWPADIPPPQVEPVLMKGSSTRMFMIGIANVDDLLVSVTVCDSLVRVTICSPKESFLGLTPSLGRCLAKAGPADAVIKSNSENTKPANDRTSEFKRI